MIDSKTVENTVLSSAPSNEDILAEISQLVNSGENAGVVMCIIRKANDKDEVEAKVLIIGSASTTAMGMEAITEGCKSMLSKNSTLPTNSANKTTVAR